MIGAKALLSTLVDAGVTTCFTNPGTSEMHFVAALDSVPEMRAVLALFEGVATGAADGYARMAGQPAATLLHLGPGLGNGLANLHNARRARCRWSTSSATTRPTHTRSTTRSCSPTSRRSARNVSGWVRTSQSTAELRGRRGRGGRRGSGPARPGRDADPARRRVLVGRRRARRAGRPRRAGAQPPARSSTRWRRQLRGGEPTALLLGGRRCASPGCWRPPGSPRRPGRSCSPRRSRPAWSAAPGCRPSSGSPTSPSWRRSQLAGLRAPRPRRREGAGVVLRLPGQEELPGARRLRRARAGGAGGDALGALEALAEALGAGGRAGGSRRPGRRARPAS